MAHKKCTSHRDSLVVEHLQLARRVARKLARRSGHLMAREDIEGAAVLGLIQAAERYDQSRGEPFFAFAIKRVRGAVQDELRRQDKLSRRSRQKARSVARVAGLLERRLGRPANDAEIASEAKLTDSELAEVRCSELAAAAFSYDDALAAGEHNQSPYIEHALDRRRDFDTVRGALSNLADRDRQVVELYYFGFLSLREIGVRLGVSESRVSQIRSRAERNLRTALLARGAAPSNDAVVAP